MELSNKLHTTSFIGNITSSTNQLEQQTAKRPPVTRVETTNLENPTITHGENRRNILSSFQKFFTWAVKGMPS